MPKKNIDISKITDFQDKIAVVTGANSGFGFFIAKKLAEKGIMVVFACRNEQKATVAMQKIMSEMPTAKLDFIRLDLSDLSSIRHFVKIYKEQYKSINLLINNAGILFVPHAITNDGFEQIFQTNYLGHFLLVNLLLPLFPDESKSKIITQSSVMYKLGKIHFNDFNLTKRYSKVVAYTQSKLAATLFALELQRRLELNNKKIQSVLAHPGVSIETDILKNKIIKSIAIKVCSFFSQPAEKGAMSAVAAALSDEVKGGEFIGLNGFIQGKGEPVKISISPKATNKETAKKLWEMSCKLCQISEE